MNARLTGVPTTGELASQALTSFMTLHQADGNENHTTVELRRQASLLFAQAVIDLCDRFPSQTRASFSSALPFTRLESELLSGALAELSAIADAMAQRLVEWATRSPVLVDEASIHASDFLARLAPHLDLWDQRAQAIATAERLAAI